MIFQIWHIECRAEWSLTMDNRQLYVTALAERVRALRDGRSWTQAYLATQAGLSAVEVQGIEHGKKSNPTLKTLVGLSNALGAPIGYLVGEFDCVAAEAAHMPPVLWEN